MGFRAARGLSIFLASTSLLLAGCGMNNATTPTGVTGVPLVGKVHGGNLPVTGSTIQLYAAGNTGYGSVATPLLTPAAVTDNTGSFNITGDFHCPTADTQVYIVSTGGNPGLPDPSTNNTALAMMAALGNCGDLNGNTHIIINEASTVAAVWALAPFMTSYDHVGTSATNAAGLAHSFNLATTIVGTAIGTATPTTYVYPNPPTVFYPQYVVNSLANSLAACVNSNGSTAASTPCATLFSAATPPGGNAPGDTIAAALNIANHPASNVGTIFTIAVGVAPFQPALSLAPNDWLVGITYDAFIKFYSDAAMDVSGNFWVQSYYMSSQAETFSPAGNTAVDLGGLSDYSIAFDQSGKIWSVVQNASSHKFITVTDPVTKAQVTYTNANVAPNFSAHTTFDSAGNAWVPSTGGYSVVSSAGALLTPTSVNIGSYPVADTSGNLWSASAGSLLSATLTGSTIGTTSYSVSNLASPIGVAFDHNGALWALNADNSLSKFGGSGNPITTSSNFTGGGLNVSGTNFNRPIAVDGAGNLWIANYTGNTISEFSNSGTAISPAQGYAVYIPANAANSGGYVPVSTPVAISVDNSGNVWTVGLSSQNYPNPFDTTITEYLGAAVPVVAPLSVAAATNTIGTRP